MIIYVRFDRTPSLSLKSIKLFTSCEIYRKAASLSKVQIRISRDEYHTPRFKFKQNIFIARRGGLSLPITLHTFISQKQ